MKERIEVELEMLKQRSKLEDKTNNDNFNTTLGQNIIYG